MLKEDFIKKQVKKTEREFFDRYAGQRRYEVLGEKGHQRLLSKFESLVQPRKGEELIELGCGAGAFTQRLTKLNLDITGMDISFKSIALAKKNIPDVEFVVGDIEDTGFKNNSFDIIVYSGVLHHFPDLSKVLGEGFRILRPGGRLFSYDPNLRNPIMWLYRHPKSPFYSSKGLTLNERLLTKEEIERKLKKAGFRKVKVESISGITYKSIEGKIASSFLLLYNLWESLFAHLSISKRWGSFLISWGLKERR